MVRAGSRIAILLSVFALLPLAATPAWAIDCVADAGGVIDGFVNYPVPPPQINIDGNCTIRNYTAANPLTSNISWEGNNPTSWLLIFDNVVHTGNMACNLNSQGNKIWFVNSASSTVQDHCLSLLIPVEKIDKQNPPGPPFVTIGVPFTWSLIIPVLFDPATGTVINTDGSVNDLHSITVWDDLNATGVDLSYVSHTVTWLDDGTPVPHTFTNVGGFLTFDNIPVVDAGRQFVIRVSVVLNDTPAVNFPGRTFINTARWDFGRLIDGTFFEPLPGENGVSPPLTISGPVVVVDKSGPATMNLGQWGDFTLDVQNTGLTDAWDVSLRDLIPDGPTGGMCDLAPEIQSVQVFAADGVTAVPGKGPLSQGTDYTLTWSGTPACRLDLTMLTAAARIGPNERLIVRYRAQLDANTQNGATLTNVAGAIRWFNGSGSNPDRVVTNRTLTNGTVGVQDHEDAHTVTVAFTGSFFEKTVGNLTSGANPATTAAPGDRLRYTLRFRTFDSTVTNFQILDELDALNGQASFVPGSLALVTYPPTANISNTNPNGGTRGTGVLDIRNLNVPLGGQLIIEFEVTLAAPLANGTVVSNQSALRLANGTLVAMSDDPNVNGTADPDVPGDEDPTRITIQASPAFVVQKISTDRTGDPNVLLAGETLRYTITVRNAGNGDAVDVVLRDAVPVNTTYVSGSTTLNGATVADVGGTSPLVNGMLIRSSGAAPGVIVPGGVATITFDVVVNPNVADGTVISNQGFASAVGQGIVDQPSDDPDTPIANDPTQDVVGNFPLLYAEKRVVLFNDLGSPGVVDPGDTLRYTITVQNSATVPATGVVLTDSVPANTTYVANSTRLNGLPVGQPDGGVSPLASGIDISSSDLTPPLPGTGAGTISPGETAVLEFDLLVNLGTPAGTLISNQAVVDSTQLPDLLTDGDGNPATGPEPTVVVVGAGQVLSITKQVSVVGGGAALPGSTLEYVVQVRNIAAVPALSVVLTDTLPAGLAYVSGSATMNGATTGVTVVGATITADYSTAYGPLDPGQTVILRFRAVLDAGLTDGTVVTNTGVVTWNTPTRTASASVAIVVTVPAPTFVVQKISTDLTGDPNVLLAGETLRYTITVRNAGDADAVDVVLRDAIPVNTTYVSGSTTLNGATVADVGGTSPLVNGMLIRSPGAAPGEIVMGGVATITLGVVVNLNVVNGTVISNQGFVDAVGQGIVGQPSDDPDTPIANDPTRDVVGNFPLLYAEKRVVLFNDLGSPGIVDPGDTLRYTITVQNSAAILATGVVLTDSVPANTTYVANSTRLNGLPVGQPDGGVSPLASGIDISSSDLTPPLPGAGAGTISPGETAVLVFDLLVNPGTPTGTLISNQAVVDSTELPDLLTDGDGNPATGPEPTVVVVGAGQQLSITKQVSVVGGGAALPGATLEYVVQVANIAAVPALSVILTDTLPAGQLAYVAGSATMNGAAAGVTVAGSTISADYGALNGALDPGQTVVLRFRAVLDPGLAQGAVVTNTGVVAWNTPTQTASASVSIVVGGIPGVSALNGFAWHDADFDDVRDSGERVLAGWAVDLYLDGVLIHTALTDASGAYRILGVEPNDVSGRRYELRFRAPGAGAATAMLGLGASPFTNGLQQISDIVVPPDANLLNLNLPIDPNGVVYNSMARIPVVGVTLTLLNAGSGSPLPPACFDDAAQQGQVTLADGYYKFDVNFSDPACPSGGDYVIAVTAPPGANYVAGYSQIIPPTSDASTTAFSVPGCPGSPADTRAGTGLYCEVQPSEFAPAPSVLARSAGTTHHVHLMLDGSQTPGSSQAFNNHIPLDPQLEGSVAISKTTPLLNVTRAQLVPYVITVNNVAGLLLSDVTILDRFPAGFSYVAGSALLDGVPTEPSIVGRELRWNGLVFAGTQVRTVKLLLAVGGGVGEGEFVNRAQVMQGVTGAALSGEATATVRVLSDPTFDCTDVLGKVFNDANRSGVQDDGEEGLPGVRVVTARGLQATTDAFGRFHITCAVTPHESRGSNFVLKLDDRTLPSGFRMSTDQVQIKRATRGKALKFDFGASVHRVVAIDLSDPAFEPGTTDIRVQWRPRLDLLLQELRKAPAVLRLCYVADTEDAELVQRRVEAVKKQLTEAWGEGDYPLTIEPEIFWRLGGPPQQPSARVQDGR
jgi:uncharacterized repeat protein (TIGR01451 family)